MRGPVRGPRRCRIKKSEANVELGGGKNFRKKEQEVNLPAVVSGKPKEPKGKDQGNPSEKKKKKKKKTDGSRREPLKNNKTKSRRGFIKQDPTENLGKKKGSKNRCRRKRTAGE